MGSLGRHPNLVEELVSADEILGTSVGCLSLHDGHMPHPATSCFQIDDTSSPLLTLVRAAMSRNPQLTAVAMKKNAQKEEILLPYSMESETRDAGTSKAAQQPALNESLTLTLTLQAWICTVISQNEYTTEDENPSIILPTTRTQIDPNFNEKVSRAYGACFKKACFFRNAAELVCLHLVKTETGLVLKVGVPDQDKEIAILYVSIGVRNSKESGQRPFRLIPVFSLSLQVPDGSTSLVEGKAATRASASDSTRVTVSVDIDASNEIKGVGAASAKKGKEPRQPPRHPRLGCKVRLSVFYRVSRRSGPSTYFVEALGGPEEHASSLGCILQDGLPKVPINYFSNRAGSHWSRRVINKPLRVALCQEKIFLAIFAGVLSPLVEEGRDKMLSWVDTISTRNYHCSIFKVEDKEYAAIYSVHAPEDHNDRSLLAAGLAFEEVDGLVFDDDPRWFRRDRVELKQLFLLRQRLLSISGYPICDTDPYLGVSTIGTLQLNHAVGHVVFALRSRAQAFLHSFLDSQGATSRSGPRQKDACTEDKPESLRKFEHYLKSCSSEFGKSDILLYVHTSQSMKRSSNEGTQPRRDSTNIPYVFVRSPMLTDSTATIGTSLCPMSCARFLGFSETHVHTHHLLMDLLCRPSEVTRINAVLMAAIDDSATDSIMFHYENEMFAVGMNEKDEADLLQTMKSAGYYVRDRAIIVPPPSLKEARRQMQQFVQERKGTNESGVTLNNMGEPTEVERGVVLHGLLPIAFVDPEGLKQMRKAGGDMVDIRKARAGKPEVVRLRPRMADMIKLYIETMQSHASSSEGTEITVLFNTEFLLNTNGSAAQVAEKLRKWRDEVNLTGSSPLASLQVLSFEGGKGAGVVILTAQSLYTGTFASSGKYSVFKSLALSAKMLVSGTEPRVCFLQALEAKLRQSENSGFQCVPLDGRFPMGKQHLPQLLQCALPRLFLLNKYNHAVSGMITQFALNTPFHYSISRYLLQRPIRERMIMCELTGEDGAILSESYARRFITVEFRSVALASSTLPSNGSRFFSRGTHVGDKYTKQPAYHPGQFKMPEDGFLVATWRSDAKPNSAGDEKVTCLFAFIRPVGTGNKILIEEQKFIVTVTQTSCASAKLIKGKHGWYELADIVVDLSSVSNRKSSGMLYSILQSMRDGNTREVSPAHFLSDERMICADGPPRVELNKPPSCTISTEGGRVAVAEFESDDECDSDEEDAHKNRVVRGCVQSTTLLLAAHSPIQTDTVPYFACQVCGLISKIHKGKCPECEIAGSTVYMRRTEVKKPMGFLLEAAHMSASRVFVAKPQTASAESTLAGVFGFDARCSKNQPEDVSMRDAEENVEIEILKPLELEQARPSTTFLKIRAKSHARACKVLTQLNEATISTTTRILEIHSQAEDMLHCIELCPYFIASRFMLSYPCIPESLISESSVSVRFTQEGGAWVAHCGHTKLETFMLEENLLPGGQIPEEQLSRHFTEFMARFRVESVPGLIPDVYLKPIEKDGDYWVVHLSLRHGKGTEAFSSQDS